MYIIFLTKYFPPDAIGGGEISAYYLGRSLAKRGHKIIVIKRGEENQNLKQDGLTVLARKKLFNQEAPNFELAWARRQAKILLPEIPQNAEIIHAHDFHSALIAAELKKLLRSKPRFIATVRDYWPVCGYGKVKINGEICPGCEKWTDFRDCPKVSRGNILQKYARMFRYYYNIPKRQKSLNVFDQVVYISQGLQTEIRKSKNMAVKIRAETVIGNPIPDDVRKNTVNSAGNGKTILFAGLLDLHKGLDFLLKALRQVAKKNDFSLVIAGSGPRFEIYKKMVANFKLQDKVNFLGHVPYRLMSELYNKADIVISPGLWPEPFGRSLLEGMAYGKAVIATNHGAPPEFIQNNQTGILVEPGNVLELAERIIFLLQNPEARREMGVNARKYVLENFAPEKIAKEYEIIYQVLK